MAFSVENLKLANAKRWEAAKLTRASEYTNGKYAPVPRILAAKNRYELIERQTGVHRVFTACAHYRESNLNFSRQLAQGDPLSQVSRNVPKGRGPFSTFEAGAYDALVVCQPKAALNPLWKSPAIMPGMLTLLEMYNGLGYARMGRPSAYVWAGTDQYVSGKYVSDGVYSSTAVDTQLGVAGLIMTLQKADSEFCNFQVPKQPPAQKPSVQPPQPVPAPKPQEGPILNKEGEDITDMLAEFWAHLVEDFKDDVHHSWEWLREH